VMERGGKTTALGGGEAGRRERAKSLPTPQKEPHRGERKPTRRRIGGGELKKK
jgi:hypothetical protein